MSKIKERRI